MAYRIEYSKSSKALCKSQSCTHPARTIYVNEIRIHEPGKGFYHWNCLSRKQYAQIGSLARLTGHEKLTEADSRRVQSVFQPRASNADFESDSLGSQHRQQPAQTAAGETASYLHLLKDVLQAAAASLDIALDTNGSAEEAILQLQADLRRGFASAASRAPAPPPTPAAVSGAPQGGAAILVECTPAAQQPTGSADTVPLPVAVVSPESDADSPAAPVTGASGAPAVTAPGASDVLAEHSSVPSAASSTAWSAPSVAALPSAVSTSSAEPAMPSTAEGAASASAPVPLLGAAAAGDPSRAPSKAARGVAAHTTAAAGMGSAAGQRGSRGAKQVATAQAQAQRQAVHAPGSATSSSAGTGTSANVRAAPTTPAMTSSSSTAPGSSVLNLRQLLRESNEKRKVELQGRHRFPRFRNSLGQPVQGLKGKTMGSSL